MGCVKSVQKQKQDKPPKDHQKDGRQIKKKSEFRSPTYTSIEDALEKRNGQTRRSSRHLPSSQQMEVLSKYRMSAEQNKCAVPKITAGEYGPMLVHNPGIIETNNNHEKTFPYQAQLITPQKVNT